MNDVSSKVTRLNIQTLEKKELPELNQARCHHASLILNGHLYVLGGRTNAIHHSGSIECLSISRQSNWHILLEGSQLVQRATNASVVAISATKLMVFGGYCKDGFFNTGYIFDLISLSLHRILGRQNDQAFNCSSQTVWIGKQRHVTLAEDKRSKLHLVQMQYEKKNYAEVRSIQRLRHSSENDDAEM